MRNLFINQPTAIIPNANAQILNEKPIYTTRILNIHDHTFAQITAQIALGNVNNPAQPNACIISVTTPLDCKIVVIQKALMIALKGVLATLLSHFLSVAPESSCIASSSTSIPKSTIATHARKFQIEKSIVLFLYKV